MGFTDKLAKVKENIIILRYSKHIDTEALQLPQWVELKDDYNKLTDNPIVDKACTSLINSMIFQQRAVFSLTRRATRELVKNDPNWQPRIGLKNGNYDKVIQTLCVAGIIKQTKKGANRTLSQYEVVDEHILEYIGPSIIKQRKEVTDFIDNYKGDSKEDKSGDLELEEEIESDAAEENTAAELQPLKASAPEVNNGPIGPSISNKKVVNNGSSTKPFDLGLQASKEDSRDTTNPATAPPKVSKKGSIDLMPITEEQQVPSREAAGQANQLNLDHSKLLQTALNVPSSKLSPFEVEFLNGKQEALKQYGFFKEKQITILEKIASKAVRPVQEKLTQDILVGTIKADLSTDNKLLKLKSYKWSGKGANKLNECICWYSGTALEAHTLIDYYGIREQITYEAKKNIARKYNKQLKWEPQMSEVYENYEASLKEFRKGGNAPAREAPPHAEGQAKEANQAHPVKPQQVPVVRPEPPVEQVVSPIFDFTDLESILKKEFNRVEIEAEIVKLAKTDKVMSFYYVRKVLDKYIGDYTDFRQYCERLFNTTQRGDSCRAL